MPKVRFLVAAALLSTSVSAYAANLLPTSPLIQVGDDLDILFDSAVALEVTDNLYSSATKTASTSWTGTPGLTLPGTYDVLGRSFYMGFKARF